MIKSIFHKKKRTVSRTSYEDNKKESNAYLKLIGKWNNDDYPLEMRAPVVAARDTFYNNVYLYTVKDNIEYVILEKREENCFSASAYIKNQDGMKDRIGTTFCEYTKYDDVYLDRYVVHPDFRKKGVGGKLLLSIICFELENFELDKNIYVHAVADNFPPKALSQRELESHYEKYGIVLCQDEDAAENRNVMPNETVRNNLLEKIKHIKN